MHLNYLTIPLLSTFLLGRKALSQKTTNTTIIHNVTITLPSNTLVKHFKPKLLRNQPKKMIKLLFYLL